jgi:serine/threonine-protein kinase
VKVVDFGLVKDISSYGADSLSVANTIAGTPHYLAPEAIRSPQNVDGRCDLYAVGVLGYYLLTGKHVFEGESFLEICGHHLHTKPVPPSAKAAHAISKDLESLLLLCLEKDPAARPPDAGSLARALEACAAAGTWGEDEAKAWWGAYEARQKTEQSPLEPTGAFAAGGPSTSAPTTVMERGPGKP